jgi:hypothetical protein
VTILLAAISTVRAHITPRHRAAAREALAETEAPAAARPPPGGFWDRGA